MGIFANYMQVKLNEMENTIFQVLNQKETQGQTPYTSTWPNTGAMQQQLGLTPQQMQLMQQNGSLAKGPNGFQINKNKLQSQNTQPQAPQPKQYQQYPQSGINPQIGSVIPQQQQYTQQQKFNPQAGMNPQVNQAGTTPAIQGLVR